MAGLFTTITSAARRGGAGPPGPPRRPLWPLVKEEARHAVAAVVRPTSLVAAVVAGVTVFVVLGPATPGPVLPTAWRPILATLLALVAAVFAHLLLGRSRRRDRRPAALAVVAAIALVVAGTVVIANLLDVLTAAFPAPTGPAPLQTGLAVDPLIAVGGVLLAAAIAASALGARVAVPVSLLFLGIGMLVGPYGLAWVDLDAGIMRDAAIVGLVVILFEGGVTTSVADLRRAVAPAAVLATVGVMATAAITAGIVLLVLPDATARTAWLVGAVVASTDAAALANLLRSVRLPHRIHALLTVESGGNDAVALLLTVGILASWDGPVGASQWLSFALWQLAGGLVAGVVVGALGARLMDRLDLAGMALYPVLALSVAGAAYGAAAVVGASGLLAASTAGVVVAASTPRHRRAIRRFSDGLASAVGIGLFLLLGLQVAVDDLVDLALPGLAIAIGLVVVARPIAVTVSLAGFRLPWRDVGLIGWLGVRGAVPIVLATYAATVGVPEADAILDLTFFVVVVSLLLYAGTARRAAARAGVVGDPTPASPEIAVLVGDMAGPDLLEATVTSSSPVVGHRLAQRPPDRGIRVLLVTRSDTTFPADGDTVLRVGDRLVVSATDRDGLPRLRRWLAPEPGQDRD